MILQALHEYYQKKDLPPEGFQKKEIPFLIVISHEGLFLNLENTREGTTIKQFLVPKDRHTTGKNAWEVANIFWDHYGYVLGHPKDSDQKSKEMAAKQMKSFIDVIAYTLNQYPDSPAIQAVSRFYQKKEWMKVFGDENWQECARRKGCNLTFRIDGIGIITDTQEAKEFARLNMRERTETDEDGTPIEDIYGICLITGERGLIARTHTPTPIYGSRSNAKIVSFQKNSGYDSYGKTQGTNAPIITKSESAYTSALKHLLSKESRNDMLVGLDTILFWADTRSASGQYDLENDFSSFFADPPRADPDRGILAVKALYEAIYSGTIPVDEGNRFYVLGLTPNAARVSVRFWKIGTIRQFADKIKKHFDDMEILRSPKDREYLTLNQILRATVLDYKMDNVPPNLAGAVVESILDGTPYPITLLHQCIRRVRAEQHVTRTRAAILKGYVNRINRYYKPDRKEEITMSLDRTNTSTGYRLGRLFAVLEKIQEEANPGINTTIRDRFYGAASSSPVAVFPQLLKLKNHHLSKLTNPGRKVNFEKELGEIFDGLKDLPPHLSMEDQARFAIGYYHQRQSFFNS
jgi:CRISPR-associated protein Csd1